MIRYRQHIESDQSEPQGKRPKVVQVAITDTHADGRFNESALEIACQQKVRSNEIVTHPSSTLILTLDPNPPSRKRRQPGRKMKTKVDAVSEVTMPLLKGLTG